MMKIDTVTVDQATGRIQVTMDGGEVLRMESPFTPSNHEAPLEHAIIEILIGHILNQEQRMVAQELRLADVEKMIMAMNKQLNAQAALVPGTQQ
jgi:hypothetical protein